jgi:hypothetical protein
MCLFPFPEGEFCGMPHFTEKTLTPGAATLTKAVQDGRRLINPSKFRKLSHPFPHLLLANKDVNSRQDKTNKDTSISGSYPDSQDNRPAHPCLVLRFNEECASRGQNNTKMIHGNEKF